MRLPERLPSLRREGILQARLGAQPPRLSRSQAPMAGGGHATSKSV